MLPVEICCFRRDLGSGRLLHLGVLAMTRDWDTPPALKGRVELIEQRGFVTRTLPADRIAQAQLRDDRWPLGICLIIWLALLVALWAGIIALLRWAL
jgi:hypothetical protein